MKRGIIFITIIALIFVIGPYVDQAKSAKQQPTPPQVNEPWEIDYDETVTDNLQHEEVIYTVPSDKILIIETVSVFLQVWDPPYPRNPRVNELWIPLHPGTDRTDGITQYVGLEQVRYYVMPDQPVTIIFGVKGGGEKANVFFNVSGYLVPYEGSSLAP